jgi:hypothetical protein
MLKAVEYKVRLFNREIRKLPFVLSLTTDYCINGDLLPIVEITAVIETKEPVQTSQYLKIIELFINHFGDQAIPTIETGPTTVVISKGRFTNETEVIHKSFYAQLY